MSANTAAKQPTPILTAAEEEATLRLDSFQRDAICSQCGFWKSEHDYTVCSQPNWIQDQDD